jgi:hypothetical protein
MNAPFSLNTIFREAQKIRVESDVQPEEPDVGIMSDYPEIFAVYDRQTNQEITDCTEEEDEWLMELCMKWIEAECQRSVEDAYD